VIELASTQSSPWIFYIVYQHIFPTMDQMVSISGFVGHTVSAATQLCFGSEKAAIDNMQTNEGGFAPV
jgi:hypothetical protein